MAPRYLIGIVFLLLFHGLYAQDRAITKNGMIRMGLDADVGGITYINDDLATRSPGIRFYSDAGASIRVTHYLGKWGIQAGVGYSKMLYKINNGPSLFEAIAIIPLIFDIEGLELKNARFRRNKLNIPIGTEFAFYQNSSKSIRLLALGTFQNSILTGRRVSIEYEEASLNEEDKAEFERLLKDDLRTYTLRFDIGFGMDFIIPKQGLGLFFEIGYGIPIVRPSKGIVRNGFSLSCSIGVSYLFQFYKAGEGR